MKITKKKLEKLIKEEVDILLNERITESTSNLPMPKNFEKLLAKVPVIGKMVRTNALMQIAKKSYEEDGIEAMLKAIANDAVSLVPIVGTILSTYELSQNTISAMKKYIDYEKGIKNTLKPGKALDIDRLKSKKQSDFTRRLAMSLTN